LFCRKNIISGLEFPPRSGEINLVIKELFMGLILKSILISLGLSFCAGAAFAAELPVVDHVDLTRYQGKWYEIGSIPQSFQKQCVGNTTAEYEILPGSDEVRVYNSCDTKDGTRSASEGRAKVVDPDTNAKLKVTFAKIGGKYVYLFGGKYWIIKLDPNYQYVIVGHPSRDYGWILSRNPDLPIDKVRELAMFAKSKGYDICRFYTTRQTGGTFKERNSFCGKR
jgi:apolipoprotein D and lipocalin family protein